VASVDGEGNVETSPAGDIIFNPGTASECFPPVVDGQPIKK
jgi:hypothetical protein